MNQCVPSSDLDGNSITHRLTLPAPSNSSSLTPRVPSLDYAVAELTWENGQLASHGLCPPRAPNKTIDNSSPTKYTWEKQRAGGTLESIVNQATCLLSRKATVDGDGNAGEYMGKWLDHHPSLASQAAANNSVTDFLVPCSNVSRNVDNQERSATQAVESMPGPGRCVVGCSTGVGYSSGASTLNGIRRLSLVRVGMNNAHNWPNSRTEQSMSASATCGRESRHVTLDADKELGAWFTSTSSLGSQENSSSAKECTKTGEDHESLCGISRTGADDEEGKEKGHRKSSVSTKRSRAAAIHNQSERKRRDKINQRMKILQKLVPNSSKTASAAHNGVKSGPLQSCIHKVDKASMLDEVIQYLKQLQAQVQMLSRMNMSPMMLPLAMHQQLQMPMMSPIGMAGLGMGFMDINTIGRGAGMPTVVPAWDNPGDHLPPASVISANPLSAFLACQSQPMTMDAYSRMAALYQQFQQQNGSGSKN